jgi:hypothetical protein
VAATVSGVLVVVTAILVARLLASDKVPKESEAAAVAPTSLVAVGQPCA